MTNSEATLQEVAKALNDLPAALERDFLHVGHKLETIATLNGEVMNNSGMIVALLSSGPLEEMKADLGRALTSLGIGVGDTRSTGYDIYAFMGEMESSLKEAGRQAAALQRRNGVLRHLALQVRITSRYGGITESSFDPVARSLKELQYKIKEHTDAIHQSLNGLCIKVQARKKRLNESIAREIRHGIDMLNTTHEQCSTLSSLISTQSLEMASSIAGVVSSIQYHDISRQKIEHVGAALEEIHAGSHKDAGEIGHTLQGREIGDICSLLAEQLRQVHQELTGAIHTMETSLKAIVRTSSRTEENAGMLSTAAGETESSSLAVADRDLTAAITYYLKDAEVEQEHFHLIHSIVDTVGEINRFLEGIEEIGEEIKLIALNSTVKAMHLRSAGSGMRVITTAIKSESDAIGTDAATLAQQLLKTTAKAEKLKEMIEETYGKRALEQESFAALLKEKLGIIQESNRSIREVVRVVHLSSRRLQELVEDALHTLAKAAGHPAVLSEKVIPALEMCARDLLRNQPTPAGEPAGGTRLLEKLRGKYTMERERDVHDQHLKQTRAPRGKLIPFQKREGPLPAGPCHEEYLGTNVELF
jgi:hypothetical protein